LKLARARTAVIGWPLEIASRKAAKLRPRFMLKALWREITKTRQTGQMRGAPADLPVQLAVCSVYCLPRKAARINHTGMKDSAIDRYRPNLPAL
jgi:hypothetical protein